MAKYPKLPLPVQAQIITFFTSGVPAEEIAKTESVEIGHVYSVLRRNGIHTGLRGRPGILDQFTDEQLEAFISEYQGDEIPVSAILTKYAISYNQLWHMCQRLGLPPRTKSKDALLASKARMERAMQMYVDKYPLWRITAETGIHPARLYGELHKRGEKLNIEKWREDVSGK